MRTSSVANETVKHYGVTINKAMALLSIKSRGLEKDNNFTRRNVKLCVL